MIYISLQCKTRTILYGCLTDDLEMRLFMSAANDNMTALEFEMLTGRFTFNTGERNG